MKPRVVLIIAIILGLITSGLVYYAMDNSQTEQVAKKTKAVVVAKQDIKPRQVIKDEFVQIKNVPKEMVHDQAVTKLSQVVDKLALKKIIAGEQILKPRILAKKEFKAGLAFNLDNDQRAVTIAVNEVVGVAGFLAPGDHVDIVGVFTSNSGDETISKTVLQNMKVLAVAQDMVKDEKQKPKVTKSVTLAAGLDEAEKLILADNRGDIRLILRSVKDKSRKVTKGVEFEELVKQNKSTTDNYPEVTPEIKSKESKQNTDSKKTITKDNEKVNDRVSDKESPEKVLADKPEKKQADKQDITKEIEVIRGDKRNYIQVPVQ